MKLTEIAFTCYPVSDVARARKFYEGTLGLKAAMVFEDKGFSWIEYDIAGAALAICKGEGMPKPTKDGACVALEVADIEETVAELKKKGVKFTMELTQTPVCRMATIADPDGSQIMLHKRNK